GGISFPMALDGRPPEETYFNAVAPGYFATLGTPVVAGRDFAAGDESTAPLVAVVNEAFIKRNLSDTPPLGKRVSIPSGVVGRPPGASDAQIVGVVKDAIYEFVRDAAPPTVYVPFAQTTSAGRGGPSGVTIAIG